MWPKAAMRQYARGLWKTKVKTGAASRLRYSPPSANRTANGTVEPSPILRSTFSTKERTAPNSTFPAPGGPPCRAGRLLGLGPGSRSARHEDLRLRPAPPGRRGSTAGVLPWRPPPDGGGDTRRLGGRRRPALLQGQRRRRPAFHSQPRFGDEELGTDRGLPRGTER